MIKAVEFLDEKIVKSPTVFMGASFRLKDAGIFPFLHKAHVTSMWFSGMS